MPALRLEVFETGADPGADVTVSGSGSSEDDRLAAYEQGYTAGWDDASAAQADEQAVLTATLAHNLQALGFTYHEARVHVLSSLEPLLTDLTTRLLPVVARAALAPVVAEVLMPLAANLAETPVEIVMNPAARPAIAAVLEKAGSLPLTLTEEPTLGEGQVYLKIGQSEARVDLDAAIAEISAALSDFFKLSKMETSDG
jgi:flagellar biosynthesis/type III secretory pathway protein FliH